MLQQVEKIGDLLGSPALREFRESFEVGKHHDGVPPGRPHPVLVLQDLTRHLRRDEPPEGALEQIDAFPVVRGLFHLGPQRTGRHRAGSADGEKNHAPADYGRPAEQRIVVEDFRGETRPHGEAVRQGQTGGRGESGEDAESRIEPEGGDRDGKAIHHRQDGREGELGAFFASGDGQKEGKQGDLDSAVEEGQGGMPPAAAGEQGQDREGSDEEEKGDLNDRQRGKPPDESERGDHAENEEGRAAENGAAGEFRPRLARHKVFAERGVEGRG
jgi:hypothetical protein